jgi:hypothetical protein
MFIRSFVRLFALSCLVAHLPCAVLAGGGAKNKKKQPETITAHAELPPGLNLEDVVNNIIARENDEITSITLFTPIIETYIQDMKADKTLGLVPKSDYYSLDQIEFDSHRVPKLTPIVHHPKMGSALIWKYEPNGFADMVFVDNRGLDKQYYQFDYTGREFLGEIRCLVFNLTPKPKSGRGRFLGRVWVDEKDYTIVRANGQYRPGESFSLKSFSEESYLHFDMWRANVRSDLWLPSYIYSQNTEAARSFMPQFKSQSRFWGYQLMNVFHEQEFSKLTVEAALDVNDQTSESDRSPLEAQRAWRQMAERNVLETLEKDGLLAPPSPVDKVLDTIVNNLEVTNHLDNQIDLHCRVMLTSNIDMFTIGQTIVISRGLVDVMPDEGTLATMLAQEIADALVPNLAEDQYGFADVLHVTAKDVFRRMSFKDDKFTMHDNSKKALELLRNSPYADHLANTGLFLKQLNSQSKALKEFINPRIGNGIGVADQLIAAGPPLKTSDKDQIAALPLGSRIRLDPWTDEVDFMKTKTSLRTSARDKMPFEVTPFSPFLVRSDHQNPLVPAASRGTTQ